MECECSASIAAAYAWFTRGRFHNLQRMVRVAGWMSQASVDDRLEHLLGLYNAGAGIGPRLQYQRLRNHVPGRLLCSAVHSDSDNRNSLWYQCLRERLSWTDNAEIDDDTIAFLLFYLKRTLIWPRVHGVWTLQCLAVHMLMVQVISRGRKLLVRGVVLLPCALLHSHPP